MKRCATCKLWGTLPPEETGSQRRGQDYRGFRPCGNPALRYGFDWWKGDLPRDGALVEDDEGWGLLTGPDFGCVHWQ